MILMSLSMQDLVDHSQVRSSVDIHDQHSNMRLDVDNMSYEVYSIFLDIASFLFGIGSLFLKAPFHAESVSRSS